MVEDGLAGCQRTPRRAQNLAYPSSVQPIAPEQTQVVVLAGGMGTRLFPFTQTAPKVLVPVAGKPFLLHLMALLEQNGFIRYVFILGYLGNMVKQVLERSGRVGSNYRLILLEDPERYGTGGALMTAQPWCDDTFVLVYGDTYLNVDYQDLLNFFLHHRNADVAMVAYDNHDLAFQGNLAVGNDDRVRGYYKPGGPEYRFVDAGVAVLRRQVFREFPTILPVSYEEIVLPRLVRRSAVVAYQTSSHFYDIGTYSGLRKFSDFLKCY